MRKILSALAVLFLLGALTVVVLNAPVVPEPSVAERHYAAIMKAKLFDSGRGDFIKMKDGQVLAITQRSGETLHCEGFGGAPQLRGTPEVLAANVQDVYKKGTLEWEIGARQYFGIDKKP